MEKSSSDNGYFKKPVEINRGRPCRVGLNEEFGMQTEIICQIQSVKGAPSVQETLNGIDAKNFCTLPGGPHTRGYLIFYIFV